MAYIIVRGSMPKHLRGNRALRDDVGAYELQQIEQISRIEREGASKNELSSEWVSLNKEIARTFRK